MLLAVLFVIFATVSNSDYDQEALQDTHYKEMVCSGAWGNYKNLEINCKKVGK